MLKAYVFRMSVLVYEPMLKPYAFYKRVQNDSSCIFADDNQYAIRIRFQNFSFRISADDKQKKKRYGLFTLTEYRF